MVRERRGKGSGDGWLSWLREVTESQELYLIPQAEDVLGASRRPGLLGRLLYGQGKPMEQGRTDSHAHVARSGIPQYICTLSQEELAFSRGEVLFLGARVGRACPRTDGRHGKARRDRGTGPTSAPTMERHFRALLAWTGARWC